METLPNIPTPISEYWRRLRVSVVPTVVFFVCCTVIAFLWRENVRPLDMLGEVERQFASLSVPATGTLTELKVQAYQRVNAGDPIATIAHSNPALLTASLEVIKAEIELIRVGLDPVINRRRADYDYQTLTLELLNHRVDLAIARARLIPAELTYKRRDQLRSTGGISETEFEIAQANYQALQAEVESRATLITDLEKNLKNLQLPGADNPKAALNDPTAAAIAVQEKTLAQTEAELAPTLLKAPISGTIGPILRHQGETVLSGELLLTIMSEKAERLVGYIQQPLTSTPAVGMKVEVLTRTQPRLRGVGQILHISPHFEPIPETVTSGSMMLKNAGVTLALPVVIQAPEDFYLRPGELVDLRITPEH
jgi:multidrug resistance efflux pump